MVSVWLSAAGVIHYSFTNPCETIDATKYCTELQDPADKNGLDELIDPRNPDFCKNSINALASRWERCIEAAGDDFD